MNAEIWTIIGTGFGVVGFLYTIIRNFRTDFDNRFDRMEKRMDSMDQRWSETNRRMDVMHNALDQRWSETNRRMDGVYHVLLKRIKEE